MDTEKLREYLNSKAYDDRLTYRLEVNKEAQANYFKRQEVMANCLNDPKFFINNFGWINEPRLSGNTDLEFFLFPYQEEVIDDFLKAETLGEDRLFEKSRDLGFTWMVASYYLWRLIFFRGWIGLFGGRKQEEVDNKSINSFFGKFRYMFYRLPKWMIPPDFKRKLFDNENKFVNPVMNSLVQGESSNPNFGRDRRSSICVIDELFLQDYAQEIWRNVAETSKCRIGVSTPKPTRFAKSIKEAMATNGWLRSFHWSRHPFKDQEWYEKEKLKYLGDDIGLRQELELEYLSDPNILVYPQADLVKIEHKDYWPRLPIYISLDWGSAPSATVICWWQQQDKWVLLEALQVKEKPIGWYMPFLCPELEVDSNFHYSEDEKAVMEKVRTWHKGIAFYGEAAHYQKNMTTSTSIAQEMAKEPYRIQLKYNPLAIGHEARQAAVKALIRKGVVFNDTYYVRGILDSLTMAHFPKTQGIREKVAPIHDETADARSAVENFAVNIINVSASVKEIVYNKRFQHAR
jgi:hypothetical protein